MTQAPAALFAALCLCLIRSGTSQPTSCLVETNCPNGFYCELNLRYCRKCLSCEDLNRESRPSQLSCIKSVADCGPCNKGLVEDHRRDANGQCVPPSARNDDDGFPMYGWVLVALLGLLVLLLFCGIVWYVLKHPDALKTLASTSTSMQSRCERSVVPATAPENPPPYNALYTPVQPISPSPLPQPASPYSTPFNQDSDGQANDEECSSPFIKHPSPDRVWPACESAGSQAARIYNNPAYVRGALPPISYENGLPHGPKTSKLVVHDEETLESTWTPSESPDQNSNNANTSSAAVAADEGGNSDLPALLAAAKGTSLIRTPYPEMATQPCVRQDPNNNGNRNNGEPSFVYGEGGGSTSGAHGGTSFIINVVQSINTLQQRGDISH